MSYAQYQGKQLHEPTLVDKLGNLNMGEKEKTGFTENNKTYNIVPNIVGFDKFATKYNADFYDKNNPVRTEYTRLQDDYIGDIQGDGFTKSEKLHSFGKNENIGMQLQKLHPYVTRSIKARDPFYAECSRDNKILLTN